MTLIKVAKFGWKSRHDFEGFLYVNPDGFTELVTPSNAGKDKKVNRMRFSEGYGLPLWEKKSKITLDVTGATYEERQRKCKNM